MRRSGHRAVQSAHLLFMLLVARVVCIRNASSDRLELVVSYEPQLLQEVEKAVKLQGCSIQLNLERASALLVICPPLTISDGAAQAAAAVAQQQLSGIAGVRDVSFNEVAGVVPPLELVTPSSAVQSSNGSCLYTPNSANPDFMLGRDSEGVPYGVRMVQADAEEYIQLSKGVKGKVLYCVIDSGMDMNNIEMPRDATGCMPGIRTNGKRTTGFRLCTPFNTDLRGHGTLVTGVIAAVRNQLGIVGVAAEGADVYHYTGVNEQDEVPTTVMLDGLSDCVDELEYRQRSNPALKLVINMSFGAAGLLPFAVQQIVQRIAARKDVLMFAAAGNGGSAVVSYPAGFPEVISVGGVDYNQMPWSSSNYNRDVELTAAGVAVLSAYPLALANQSRYEYQGLEAIITEPVLPAVLADPTLFVEPAASVAIGSARSSVAGELVDCGLGQQQCTNAAGKICLLERGGATPTWSAFVCLKVVNCMQGGGVGAVVFNNEDACQPFNPITLLAEGCPKNVQWPTVLLISKRQGLALKEALAALANGNHTTTDAGNKTSLSDGTETGSGDPSLGSNTSTDSNSTSNTTSPTLKVSVQLPAVKDKMALNVVQGTSLASPAVAGVAGVVWSAHPLCTAAEIRKALKRSALKPWLTPGLNATDPSQQRTDRYGYGIVQGLAAHKYLQNNVCYAELPRPELLLTITPRSRKVGETVVVRVTVRLAPAASGGALPSVATRTVVLSPAAAAMSCASTRPRVNARGIASTTCKLLKSGRVVLAAQLPASRFWQAASTSQGLTVAKQK